MVVTYRGVQCNVRPRLENPKFLPVSGGCPGNMVFTEEDSRSDQPSNEKWILMFVSVSKLLQLSYCL